MHGVTLFSMIILSLPAADGRLELEPDDLRPGLLAEYRSLADEKAKASRIDPKPAFTLGRSSPHPRLPAGPFEVIYAGVISIRDSGPLSFSAFVGGEIVMTVDGVVVLEGRGTIETTRLNAKATIERPAGEYRVSIRYRSLADVPARLQIWWAGPGFASEPLPAWRLGHIVSELTPAAKQDDLAARGKQVAGKLGCARCHASSLPAVDDPPPGPSLADIGKRVGRDWMMHWLAEPAKVRSAARMPALFASNRDGFVERWIVADQLSGSQSKIAREVPKGEHRRGRLAFLNLGCAACHFVPDIDRADQKELNRSAFETLADRFAATDLAVFLGNPHGRYPDGRMPRLPVTPEQARDISAYLLLWSKPSEVPKIDPPTVDEIQATAKRLGARDAKSAAETLLRDKGCASCHTGLGDSRPLDLPIQKSDVGCLAEKSGPRFTLAVETRRELQAYLAVAKSEKHDSPFTSRQNRLAHAGCMQCHQRDSDRSPPIEEAGSKLGGAFLQELPFQRTPRLTNPHQKLTRSYLATTVREGNPGLKDSRYSYRMPAYGHDADVLIQALAEADGELISESDPPKAVVSDPTLGTLHGARLAGFQGYGCVSCHVWNGNHLAVTDPGVSGPDLTKTSGRLRREWVDRFLEAPLRYYPGTPMPSVFAHGRPATLTNVLDGDAAKQKEALWAYFALGKDAPSPKPPPPLPIDAPATGEVLVAQIPIRVENKPIESISLLTSTNDLLVYNLATGSPTHIFNAGRILRNVQGRTRQFIADGELTELVKSSEILLSIGDKREPMSERLLLGYNLIEHGFRVRWQVRFGAHSLTYTDELSIQRRELKRRIDFSKLPEGASFTIKLSQPLQFKQTADSEASGVATRSNGDYTFGISPDKAGRISLRFKMVLAKEATAPKWDLTPTVLKDDPEGSLVRPGYKAIAYPRPRTVSGEDRVMPSAVAVRPKDGQVFVASMKTGEFFALKDPSGDGMNARFERYGNGLYQDALSMLAEDDGLYVLHRRNLTKIVESMGQAREFERVAALPHGISDTYDMAYGLARDKEGRFVFGYAAYADGKMPGAGGVLRLKPGKPPEEVAYGLRNALGWCAGPDGEVFFTDNQGDWVAANKLCHIEQGKFYGWPNRSQPQHTSKPAGKATVWVPYSWARSINGVAYDNTGGKFGPFAGQIFMAELMYGGAIIRANVEKVNGVYQGACFPFWGKGLLGPVTLAFDPRGKLFVGGITEPGWMAQPDRGALFRIDYTGQVPFEMKSIHVQPRGFRIVFTSPIDPKTASDPASYRLEHYRYEYTGSYGSPELDRTGLKVERVEVSADGLTAELTTSPLVKNRVYMIEASGVRSTKSEKLVRPTGAYTLNEVPNLKK